MATRIVSGFQHAPGIHCGSTGMRDLLAARGLALSEAMCFGLGSGLGFAYYASPIGRSPSHLFYGRTATLERDLCVHLALDFEEGQEEDGERAWKSARAWIDRDIPLLLHVELSRLPYYQTSTPFPGHRVVLAGYDDARRVAFLADTQFPGLQEVSYDVLRAARSAKIPPIPLHNEWLAVKPSPAPRPLREAIRLALRDNALGMNLDRAPHMGIMGMETLAEDFSNWADSTDWELCVRFAYQNIEVRGTGGGCFRRLYAAYLREAEAQDEGLRAAGLADTMEEIAGEWSALAAQLRWIAAEHAPRGLAEAGRSVRRLARREESFWGQVLDLGL